MPKQQSNSQGFVLIAALLMLFLLSGVAVGVMMLANSEIKIGGNDKESNRAFYGAESGMEKLTSDLASLYGAEQSPSAADIQALVNSSNYPNSAMVGPMTYAESITFPVDAQGNPAQPTSQVISSGPNQGLTALILPMTMTVNATRPNSNASANITRNIEVAQIPVFQFGIFSNASLNFSNGASFGFGGRIHTNGNLFLTTQAGGNSLLGAKTTVVGEVIRDVLQNGASVGSSFNGNAYQANATGGCDAAIAVPRAPLGSENNCVLFGPSSASWTGGVPATGSQNGSWINTSTVTFNGFIGNTRSTGVQPLTLPFAAGGGLQSDIIRKPLPLESATSLTGKSRLYNKANIRILLADTLANLHPERGAGALDAEDVNITATSAAAPVFGGDAVAWANPAVDVAWKAPTSVGTAATPFPLISGWLRVEYKDSNGTWRGVTNEWLALGIGRSVSTFTPIYNPNPTAKTGPNPNAILVLQEFASDNTGLVTRNAVATGTSWYPINFYDPREGQVRESRLTHATNGVAAEQCTVNGIMNAVELDVANLNNWITNTVNGKNVEYKEQNGYVLFFADRRGMLPSPRANAADGPLSTAGILTGEYGFEDVVNVASSPTGLPNGVDGGAAELGEDLNGSNSLDTYGAANVGDGFRVATTALGYPYFSIDCLTQGRMNRVTGARHVLRLTDGSVGNLPLSVKGGGLTVASENPVYVFGDYNASVLQQFNDPPAKNHSPAAIIADAVTLLSNNWNDTNDMYNPSDAFSRLGSNTYYRVAVAGGKSLAFSNTAGANDVTWGTDGGVQNFLRYIEAWNTPTGGSSTLSYQGSLVSLYNSTYATGTFKFGQSAVYNAPNRDYSFDQLFLNPSTLPPATPMFQDVVNLSYRQDFTPY